MQRCLVTTMLLVMGIATVSAQTVSDAAKSLAGSWEMSNADRDRVCMLTLKAEAARGGLRVEFTFSTGVLRGHEAAPIVRGDTMYLITPFPNHVYALDLTKEPVDLQPVLQPLLPGR